MNNQQKKIIILGATSSIAEASAKLWAREGAQFILVGRKPDRLDIILNNLKVIGASDVTVRVLDCAVGHIAVEFDDMVNDLGGVDIVLLAYGELIEQRELEKSPDKLHRFIETNFSSAVIWCLAAAAMLERQNSGVLIVIGSVAGDRGRRKNFIYGACKGGLTRIVEGISNRFNGSAARAVIIKPGFVDTPMTSAFDKNGFLWAQPNDIAEIIVAAAIKGGPIFYAPKLWFWIMLIIRHLPNFIFNRLNI
jgi:decaprenylphospho-beta-D-erythro-pentofuranosid-2-ulose 2-reductase